MTGPLPVRLIVRSLTGLMLGELQLLLPVHGGDLTELLVFSAIRSASLSWPAQSANPSQAAGARFDEASVRRVSISAVARSLSLPFETVRRRVAVLIDKGLVVRSGRGIASVSLHDMTSATRSALYEGVAVLHDVLQGLADAGVDLRGLASAARGDARVQPTGGAPSEAAVAAITNTFSLRVLESFAHIFGDLTQGLVLTATLHENTRALHASRELSWSYGDQDNPPPDALRTPVSLRAVAAAYAIPYETVRRHANALIRIDAMERVSGRGVIVPARALTGERFGAMNPAAVTAFLQMLAALQRVGYDLPEAAR